MNLTFHRRTELALLALRALSESGGIMSRVELAAETDTTPSYLAQVMAPLVQAGWVSSHRGPGGGYRLREAAFDAHLLDVVEVVEGPSVDGKCVLRDAPCPGDESCQIHPIWTEARDLLVERFDQLPVLQSHVKGVIR